MPQNESPKQQLLQAIQFGLTSGTITQEDLSRLAGGVSSASQTEGASVSRFSVVQLLQYVGGFIVLLGIGTFVATFWGDLSSIARVGIAVGGTLIAYVIGVVLMRTDTKSYSGIAFHLIAGCLFPFAFYVALTEIFAIEPDAGTVMVASLLLMAIYAISYTAFKHLIFTFFMLAYSISFIYSAINFFLPDITSDTYSYLTILIGAIGIYIGTTFKGTHNAPLSDLMYFLGSSAMLIAAAFLFENQPMWEVIYPFLIAGMLYVALLVHSKRILLVSVLAIMGYVIYLTSEYFADAIGWPLALVFTGIALIAIGYGAVKYKERI